MKKEQVIELACESGFGFDGDHVYAFDGVYRAYCMGDIEEFARLVEKATLERARINIGNIRHDGMSAYEALEAADDTLIFLKDSHD